jgi:citrate lyase subunit beta/citryl-CoA lyase
MPPFAAGSRVKSDCLVEYCPGKGGLELEVASSVGVLFRRAIESAARASAAEFGAGGRLAIADDGALDYVVAARCEAAFRASGLARKASAARPAASPQRRKSSRERQRRTRLYLPGNQSDLVLNAGLFGADCLLLDLEDSVAPERKAEARVLVRSLLASGLELFGDSEVAVRVNALSTPFGLEDLEEVVPAFPQALVLPKCETAADIAAYDREVARIEAESGIAPGSILFMPLVETARGVLNSAAIAAASERNAALCFGAEDYRRDMGVPRRPDELETLAARSLVAMAATAAGIGAQDSVFSDIEDEAGLEASTLAAKSLGFTGKGIVHPCQIGVVHRAFAPGEAELAQARRVVEALEAARAEGRGVVSLDGKMVDAPVAERARRLIARFEAAEKGGRPA